MTDFTGSVGPDDQDLRQQAGHADTDEILDRIVAGIPHDEGRKGERVCRHKQRVTVGRRPGHELDADQAARAGTIVHDELLPESFGKVRRQRTGDQIEVAARRRRHDDLNRFIGIVLFCRLQCRTGCIESTHAATNMTANSFFIFASPDYRKEWFCLEQ